MFRHGARTPVFRLPDTASAAVDWQSEVLHAPPSHAVQIDVQGGKSWQRSFSAIQTQGQEQARINAGWGGQLTKLGWSQGEALGRRLRAIYGIPSLDALDVVSTDM